MDIYEIDQNEEFEDKQQPTLEQIKKMVDILSSNLINFI